MFYVWVCQKTISLTSRLLKNLVHKWLGTSSLTFTTISTPSLICELLATVNWIRPSRMKHSLSLSMIDQMSTSTSFNSIISSWSLKSRRNHSHVFTVTRPRCNWAEDWPFPCLTPGLARATRRAWRYALPSAARSGWAPGPAGNTDTIIFLTRLPTLWRKDKSWPPVTWPTPLTVEALTLPEELFKSEECPCSVFDCYGVLNARKLIKASRLFGKFGEKWRAGLLKLNDCDSFHSQHWEIFPA